MEGDLELLEPEIIMGLFLKESIIFSRSQINGVVAIFFFFFFKSKKQQIGKWKILRRGRDQGRQSGLL